MSTFESDARKFGWSVLVNVVPSKVTEQNKNFILKKILEVPHKQVKNQVRTTWEDCAAAFGNDLPQDMAITVINPAGNATHPHFFYCQIKLTMISKWIEGSIDEAWFKTLLVKKKKNTWIDPIAGAPEFDGLTMLQLIDNNINSTTRVGVSNYNTDIQNATFQKFINNIQ